MKYKTTWDLSDLSSGIKDIAFQQERELMEKKYTAFARKWKKDKTFLTDEKSLKKALDQYEQISRLGNKEMMFIWLSMQVRAGDVTLQSASKKLDEFSHRMMNNVRFFILELGSIDKKQQKQFLKSKNLFAYHNFLKNIFISAEHYLSEKEEKILALKSGVASENWISMLSEFIAQEQREIYVHETIDSKKKMIKKMCGLEELITYCGSSHKKIRTTASEVLNDMLRQLLPIAEKEINSVLENKKINDELRSYDRPDSSRHINEGIDTEVVDILREVVAENFKISKDFFGLKAKLLKQDSFIYNERNLAYGKVTKTYPYDESVTLVSQALENIDSSFNDIFQEFLLRGNIDVFPRKGKRGGAFCMSHGVDDPVYVMLNHTESARDVSTIAHEMGHAIHAIFAKKENQLTYYPPMCTAEVASTFCEDFVFQELVASVSDEERLVLMMGQLQDKVNTIFRQIAVYNFELELHESFREEGFLSKDVIGNLFKKHMKSYLGPKFKLDNDAGLGWVYWSHIRRPFYVYSYAMGLLCAQAMQSEFRNDPEFINAIKEFYSTGSSLSPKEIFAKMGMDITDPHFWQSGIDEVKDLLKETKKLAKKLGKI